jgi:hypothetical protein
VEPAPQAALRALLGTGSEVLDSLGAHGGKNGCSCIEGRRTRYGLLTYELVPRKGEFTLDTAVRELDRHIRKH